MDTYPSKVTRSLHLRDLHLGSFGYLLHQSRGEIEGFLRDNLWVMWGALGHTLNGQRNVRALLLLWICARPSLT